MSGVFRRGDFIKQIASTNKQETASVPYKFRVVLPEDSNPMTRSTSVLSNSDNSGLRFPTLSSSENYRYWNATGHERLRPRTFPFHIEPYRKVNPWLREFMYFLNDLDKVRFSHAKLGERYGLKADSVRRACKSFRTKMYLRDNELVDLPWTTETRGDIDYEIGKASLGDLSIRQLAKHVQVQDRKEVMYARHVGWQEIGQEYDTEQGDEEFKGPLSTFDVVRKQTIEVEAMSAFPFGQYRPASAKRTDVDITVKSSKDMKIMNWVDPADRIIF